ncbi:MAG: glycosyltransferase family 2 protein [Desulfamplus sp.]|nr:glycosyltransferase family 2 protein [Desulfamplus sp.]
MSNRYPAWNNMIAYPDFEVDFLNEKSLFWRIEASHPFYTVNKDEALKVSNYYHEPIVIRNGLWGSRIFLESDKHYAIGLKYKSNIRLYIGLYRHGSNTPLKNWVLPPSTENLGNNDSVADSSISVDSNRADGQMMQWHDTFSVHDFFNGSLFCNKNLHLQPLHIKIVIPDTAGEFVELAGLYLEESYLDRESFFNRDSKLPKIDTKSSNIDSRASGMDICSTQFPEVAVGIVTYNRKNNIAALLEQMKKINYPLDRLKIFVVDNASTDGTDALLKQQFPEVTVLRNNENLGGAGGFNRFFKHLASMNHQRPTLQNRDGSFNQDADYSEDESGHFDIVSNQLPPFGWLIDDDAVIDKNTLIYLVRALLSDDSIAVAGSVMMDLENPSTVYEAGGDLFKDSFGWRANILHTDAGNLMHVKERIWDSGYAGAYSLLFRTEVIQKVGIWRDYFLHVDDCEWCIRIQRVTGKRVVIALDSLIWHILQGSKKPFTTLRYYETRNFLDYFASCDDKKALLRVMLQTTLMGFKQLSIKRDDLCSFHIKGIQDFCEGRFGKQPLERSALFYPDIHSLFEAYKKDRKNKGKYPGKVFLVKEINSYMNDGIDHEGDIIAQIREMSPETIIIEASMHHDDRGVRRGDRFRSLDPSSIAFPFMIRKNFHVRNRLFIKILIAIKMVKEFFLPSGEMVVLPFWNESIVPNNLGIYTAVFENGQYSLYKKNCTKAMRDTLKIIWQTCFNAVKIVRNRFDSKASHVNF